MLTEDEKKQLSEAARLIGRIGGLRKTPAKTEANRRNGLLRMKRNEELAKKKKRKKHEDTSI